MIAPTSVPWDLARLFAARIVRMFAYGFLAVVLVLYLHALGYSSSQVGLLLTLTLLGGAAPRHGSVRRSTHSNCRKLI